MSWFGNLLDRWFGRVETEEPWRFQARLPSQFTHAEFNVVFTVWWTGSRNEGVLMNVARDLIKEGKAIAADYSVLEPDLFESVLGSHCQRFHPRRYSTMAVHAVECAVEVSDNAKELAGFFAERQHEDLKREAARKLELEEIEFLRTQILTDPQTIRAWWLQKNPGKLAELVKLDADLAAFTGSGSAPGQDRATELIAAVLGKLVDRLGDTALDDLVRNFGDLMRTYQQPELAEELRRTLTPPEPNPSP